MERKHVITFCLSTFNLYPRTFLDLSYFHWFLILFMDVNSGTLAASNRKQLIYIAFKFHHNRHHIMPPASQDTCSSSVSMTTYYAQTNKHKQYTTHLLLSTASLCCMWHRHKDEIWCSAFNQMLAGRRSPLCVMEAEWWWLQTAARHPRSLVGPLLYGRKMEHLLSSRVLKSKENS